MLDGTRVMTSCTLTSSSDKILPQYRTIVLQEGEARSLGRTEFNLPKEEAKRISRSQMSVVFQDGKVVVTQLGVNPGGVLQGGSFTSLEQKQTATLSSGDSLCLLLRSFQFQVNIQGLPPKNPLKRKADVPSRPVCSYDPACYRKNPQHFQEFAHPSLEGNKKQKLENEMITPQKPKTEATKVAIAPMIQDSDDEVDYQKSKTGINKAVKTPTIRDSDDEMDSQKSKTGISKAVKTPTTQDSDDEMNSFITPQKPKIEPKTQSTKTDPQKKPTKLESATTNTNQPKRSRPNQIAEDTPNEKAPVKKNRAIALEAIRSAVMKGHEEGKATTTTTSNRPRVILPNDSSRYSILFPPLSSGSRGLPSHLVSRISSEAIYKFLESHKEMKHLKLTMVVPRDTPDSTEFFKNLDKSESRYHVEMIDGDITTPKSSLGFPSCFVVSETNWRLKPVTPMSRQLQAAAGKKFGDTAKALHKVGKIGGAFPVPVETDSPLHSEGVFWLINVVSPNLNPQKVDAVADEKAAVELLKETYDAMLLTFIQLLKENK
eukprot:TRINITY_DN4100_c0_g1_i1.p1 TRINITY_DN4100_c0_g1~~TRINITY_DN4100_c0_g1_i1.p1  ORF type:complete len:544 (-),score=98.67 TRINITY_DN4100_c0_g1_i1:721-2352(-)